MRVTQSTRSDPLELLGAVPDGCKDVLSPDALEFLLELTRRFGPARAELLDARRQRQEAFDQGQLPGFLPETRAIREGEWRVAPAPSDLCDRRVEITGPVDRKMVINALNSGARVFMADFEDSTAPTWENLIGGQRNLIDAVAGTIRYEHPVTGKRYQLSPDPAVLMVRPRGLHLPEAHLRLDQAPLPAALVDFGLFVFHNARALVEQGTGPYLYLPKLEHHLEARWWNDVFVFAQERLGLPRGTIRATVLVETLPLAFQMHEVLYELREHSAGLNCGRWDYIFSSIKTLRARPEWLTPDRGQVGMTQPFMRAYTQLQVQTCHRRGAHAMGGMAAQIPIKADPDANQRALDAVRNDKLREVRDGHDGTWVAHPGLVPLALEVFDEQMPGPNQLDVLRDDLVVTQDELLEPPTGTRSEAGLRQDVNVGLLYLESWLRGQGCVPLYHLMEDAATAEISRTQLWQWVHHAARLDDGRVVTGGLVDEVLDQELARIRADLSDERWAAGRFHDAAGLLRDLVAEPTLTDFLTTPAYELLERDA
jgi:malate synthase